MAYATTLIDTTYWGDKKVVFGKIVMSGGVATGEVDISALGIKRVLHFSGNSSDALTSAASTNEAFPCTNDITVVTTNNDDTVYFFLVGDPC